jgi:hypothetical protein
LHSSYAATAALPLTCAGFSFDKHPATSTGAHTWRFDSHEKWNKETSLDIRPSSRTQDDGEKETASSKNSQDPKANRGRDAAKGIQHGIVTRHARLKLPTSKP